MKSISERDVKGWSGNKSPNGGFKVFYLGGDLLEKLDELATDEAQSELIAELIRDEHARRFTRRDNNA